MTTRLRWAVVALVTGLVLAGCAYDDTEVTRETRPQAAEAAAPKECTDSADEDPLRSYAPRPGKANDDVREIFDRGRLIAGVAADTYLLAARNSQTGLIEGFDIDFVYAIADEIFPESGREELDDENRVELKVITAAQRFSQLEDEAVDVVVRNTTINCVRWESVAFSAQYYPAGQKVLVGRDLLDAAGLDQDDRVSAEKARTLLAGKRICAPAGTTSIDNIKQTVAPQAIAVTSTDNSACMVAFQNGEADGVSTDDTVLAGLAAQDPNAVVLNTDKLTPEPYGIGVNKERTDLVRFINGVLEDMRDDGRWQELVRPVARAGAERARSPAPARLRPMTVMTGTHPTAPVAPGSLGSAPEPAVLQAYLDALEAWVRGRRLELDRLDAAALAEGRGGEVAGDMGLSLALWKAVSDRYAEMWALWDGGRVLGAEREKITALIWGRLDTAGSSLPEACRLSDALAAQLRMKLALSTGADAAASRVRDLRAQLERIRDQVGLEPALTRDTAVDRLAGLMARLDDIADRAGRGADVLGMLAPLEQEAARYERDLIVGNARRRDARDQVLVARRHRTELLARETELERLAAACVATVDPAPGSPSPTSTRSARCPPRPRRSVPTSTGSSGSTRRSTTPTSATRRRSPSTRA